MLKRVPLASAKDYLIERWIRQTPAARGGGGLYLPKVGRPVATHRGKVRLGAAVSAYRRRVIVIAYHYRMAGQGYAKLHSHLNYIERPGAGELAVTPTLFDGKSD